MLYIMHAIIYIIVTTQHSTPQHSIIIPSTSCMSTEYAIICIMYVAISYHARIMHVIIRVFIVY